MVAKEKLRKDFSERLHFACDRAGVRARGRAVDIQAELKRRGITATTTAIGKWLNGESIPEPAKLRPLALWLGVRAAWLEYNEQPMHAEESQHGGEGEVLLDAAGTESEVEPGPRPPAADNHKETAAAKVLEMLQKHGNGLSAAVRQRIVDAVADTRSETEPPASRPSNVVSTDFSRSARVTNGDILIPQYDIRASMGHGQVPADYVEAIRNVVISESLLQDKGVTYSSPYHLAVITGWGQSMEGTINDKDPVIVDRGVNEYIGDGVYVITWAGHLFIKRLELAGENQLELISDNPNHKDRIVSMDEVTIHAKVLLVWNARKL